MSILLVVLGFALLVIGGEFLVRSSVALSFKFSISKMVIGMTVVSFATSVPELLVSLQAALSGSPAIAINNVVGSNIANIGLVLGVTAMISNIAVDKSFYKLNWPVMMLFSFALYFFLWRDKILTADEGVILFLGLIVFLFILLRGSKKDAQIEEVDDTLSTVSNFKIGIWLLIGAVALYFGSDWLVDGAKDIALSLGVSEAVIGISLIAVGTSVPELAASVVAAAKQEKAISLGNLLGSNIFNIGSVLGLTAIIKPVEVTEITIVTRDIFWMLGYAFVILPMVFMPKRFEITRVKGFILVLAYGIFTTLLFIKK
ncbi:calcium/sodium antiporter [Gaetbulibacter saemankumensis]|uniref:calcium/sodium antiporter n=1 Tax=Gaetbulibacter saemankumensis TaxID=311208 RepID=UPI00041B7C5C|nr:calcium/sodium antiporter [Gaetbulibacter saemankumensis]